MPQFRQNFITKEWVLIAPERAKRPDQFKKKEERKALPEHDPKCPFCPGNESQTPPSILEIKSDGKWQHRVVPNKFAAVNPGLKMMREPVGCFLSANGFGIAEVVIESPRHDQTFALLSHDEVKNVLELYKSRYSSLSANKDIDLITIFRNHGERAGTSLEHPHSQIIATPIIPPQVRMPLEHSQLYHDSYGDCPHCVRLAEELKQKDRVIMETPSFVAFCPFASKIPFEVQIMPKKHNSRFDSICSAEVDDLAKVLRMVLKKIYYGLNNPDYNFVILSSPNSDGELHYDHWRLVIVPKLTTPAGFEIGTGIFINIMPPETAAKFLYDVEVD